jgi:hypothetical protein
MVTKFAFVACFAGLAMLITGLLPQDKMDKVRAALGDTKKYENGPPVRMQFLLAAQLFYLLGCSCWE